MSAYILFPKGNTISSWARAGYPKSTRQLSRLVNGCGQGFRELRGKQLETHPGNFQRRDWYRYSVGLAPHIWRKTRAKCCCVLKPQATATSSTRISGERNISLGRRTRNHRRHWCGVRPVVLRKTCEKCAALIPTVRAISSRLKSSSIFSCINSLIFRNLAGLSPPRRTRTL